MHRTRTIAARVLGGLSAAGVGAAMLAGAAIAADKAPTVIELTQTGCQFIETENGVDHEFKTTKAADCVAINAKTGPERLAKAKVLKLKPGEYVFRVTNRDVPYELGFWVREKGYDYRNPLHKLTKQSVSGGGLVTGKTQDYKITIKAGTEYVYSCPLNPTPDYRIVVDG